MEHSFPKGQHQALLLGEDKNVLQVYEEYLGTIYYLLLPTEISHCVRHLRHIIPQGSHYNRIMRGAYSRYMELSLSGGGGGGQERHHRGRAPELKTEGQVQN